jgi:hypothetical protein
VSIKKSKQTSCAKGSYYGSLTCFKIVSSEALKLLESISNDSLLSKFLWMNFSLKLWLFFR